MQLISLNIHFFFIVHISFNHMLYAFPEQSFEAQKSIEFMIATLLKTILYHTADHNLAAGIYNEILNLKNLRYDQNDGIEQFNMKYTYRRLCMITVDPGIVEYISVNCKCIDIFTVFSVFVCDTTTNPF